MQPVRPWNDQTGHLPDWLVGPRTQLMTDYNQILSVIRLCHRRPARRRPAVGRRVESRIRWQRWVSWVTHPNRYILEF